MSRAYEWTPANLTDLRTAWRNKPEGQSTGEFDREFAAGLACTPRTVQRKRSSLGLRSNPRRVTR